MQDGFKNGNAWKKDNNKLSFTIIVPEDSAEKVRVAEKIKQNLSEISVGVVVKKLSFADFQKSIIEGNFELALASMDIKNEYQIQDIISTDNQFNYSRYSSNEADAVISKLKNSANEVYAENMEELKRIYLNEMPYIGLYFKNNTILTNKAVKGEYKSTAYSPYRNLINFCK